MSRGFAGSWPVFTGFSDQYPGNLQSVTTHSSLENQDSSLLLPSYSTCSLDSLIDFVDDGPTPNQYDTETTTTGTSDAAVRVSTFQRDTCLEHQKSTSSRPAPITCIEALEGVVAADDQAARPVSAPLTLSRTGSPLIPGMVAQQQEPYRHGPSITTGHPPAQIQEIVASGTSTTSSHHGRASAFSAGPVKHNKIEKQRRDKLNHLIEELRTVLPGQGGGMHDDGSGRRVPDCKRPKHCILSDAILLLKTLQDKVRGQAEYCAHLERMVLSACTDAASSFQTCKELLNDPQFNASSAVRDIHMDQTAHGFIVKVRCPSRPGLLLDLSGIFASLGLTVRTAAVTTNEFGFNYNVFDLCGTARVEDLQKRLQATLATTDVATTSMASALPSARSLPVPLTRDSVASDTFASMNSLVAHDTFASMTSLVAHQSVAATPFM